MELELFNEKSEIGLFPAQWNIMYLKELILLKNGYSFSSKYFSNKGPIVLTPGNFKLEGGLKFNDRNTIRYSGEYNPSSEFKRGDLLIVMTDLTPECNLLGKSAFVDTDDIVLHNQRIGKIIIKDIEVTKTYLYWFFLSEMFHQRMKSTATGTTVRHTSPKTIYNTLIPLPPTTEEQTAIAQVLSDTDELISSLEKLIEKKKLMKQSTMQQLLTAKKRLPGFSGEWQMKSLFELADSKKEFFNDGDWIEAEFLTESGIRLIQTGNIGEGDFCESENKKYISPESFDELNCKEVKVGDVLICRLAEPAGRACILPNINEEKMITSVDVTIFRPIDPLADKRFLLNIFSTQNWFNTVNEYCGGSTRTRIARGALGKIRLLIPEKTEQTAIAEILESMDLEIKSLENKLNKYKAIKQGMMQNLLTGKIRLV